MAGYTSGSIRNEVKMPPIIGAAIRFMTSEPVPVAHMIGANQINVVATVIAGAVSVESGSQIRIALFHNGSVR